MITIDLISDSFDIKKTGTKLTIYDLKDIESIIQTTHKRTIIHFKSGKTFHVLTEEWNELVKKGEL